MSKEIVDAVKALEQEKGISADKLMDALEDALLSAYKKTPGAAKYARVDLDHETGDFRVFELILPPELEEKLLAEAAEQQEEPEVDPETGERLDDVLMFRVADLGVKELLLADDRGIFFTTPHFDGYPAVLVRIPDLVRLDRDELQDAVVEAWLTRAHKRVAKAWLDEHGSTVD